MSAKPETTFLNSVRSKLPRSLYVMKNNNPYAAGIPDLWVSGNKGDVWIEGKWFNTKPKAEYNLTSGKNPALSALQQDWLRKRHEEGRNVCVLIGCPDGCVILTNRSWESVHQFKPVLTRQQAADWIVQQTM